MSDFGIYTGEQFLARQFEPREFLIDQIMKERDGVLVVGSEKSGKSVLIQQMICALTTGHQPFLDTYEVKKPCKVTYVQIEGELQDTQERFNNMMKALEFDPANFQIVFSEPLALQDKQKALKLAKEIEINHKPDVIIFDPLYFSFEGSLSDDVAVRQFLGNIRIIKDHFGCAIVLVHHTHKVKFDIKGNVIEEGDEATFGSAALKWWPDHVILFIRDPKTELRYFTCGTQRSGSIVKNLCLKLVQPSPLYFEKHDIQLSHPDKSNSIYTFIKARERGVTCDEVCAGLKIARSTFYYCVKGLLKHKLVIKDISDRPIKYLIVSSVQSSNTIIINRDTGQTLSTGH